MGAGRAGHQPDLESRHGRRPAVRQRRRPCAAAAAAVQPARRRARQGWRRAAIQGRSRGLVDGRPFRLARRRRQRRHLVGGLADPQPGGRQRQLGVVRHPPAERRQRAEDRLELPPERPLHSLAAGPRRRRLHGQGRHRHQPRPGQRRAAQEGPPDQGLAQGLRLAGRRRRQALHRDSERPGGGSRGWSRVGGAAPQRPG